MLLFQCEVDMYLSRHTKCITHLFILNIKYMWDTNMTYNINETEPFLLSPLFTQWVDFVFPPANNDTVEQNEPADELSGSR